jgi:heme/copper-type cytochrome/quinol oxidase subunit 3
MTDVATRDTTTYDVSTYDVLPPELLAPEPDRPRLLILGTVVVSAALTVGYASLLGVYLWQRAQAIAAGQTWLPDEVVIPLTQPNFMAATMAMAALAMAWAVYAAHNADRPNTLIALGLTMLFGFAQISQHLFLLNIMDLPIAERGVQGWLIWALAGSHIAVTGIALAFAAAMGLRTLGGHLTPSDREGILAAALFWYVTVGLYLVIWYAVYITK